MSVSDISIEGNRYGMARDAETDTPTTGDVISDVRLTVLETRQIDADMRGYECREFRFSLLYQPTIMQTRQFI